jgi:hypothetical protein
MREALDADIAALERTRELLIAVLPAESSFPSRGSDVQAITATAPATRSWHSAALKVFEDGKTHTTAEVHEAAKVAVGPDVGYSAVASWLNRMAERGNLQKDGRGEFRRPVPVNNDIERLPEATPNA